MNLVSNWKEELLQAIQAVHLANTDEQDLIRALVQFKAKFNVRYIDAKDKTTIFLLDHSVRFNKPSVVSYLLREFVREGYEFQKSYPITNSLTNAVANILQGEMVGGSGLEPPTSTMST